LFVGRSAPNRTAGADIPRRVSWFSRSANIVIKINIVG
jgi:hypothetical protein